MLTLVTGYRTSQLGSLTRHQTFSYLHDDSLLILTSSPTFLANNEQAGNLINPIRLPTFLLDGEHHTLCSVWALRDYIECTEGLPKDHLFDSKTGKPLPLGSIARILCRVIKEANPEHFPRANSIRGLAASLTFLRTHSVKQV